MSEGRTPASPAGAPAVPPTSIEERRPEALAALAGRLNGLLGDRDLGNGTPLANAAACAIVADARAAGVEFGKVLALPDAILISTADGIHRQLSARSRDATTLPFGTVSILDHKNALTIDGETLLQDAGRPGLHPIVGTPKHAHGPNLDRLRSAVAERTSGKEWSRLGLPGRSSPTYWADDVHLEWPACDEIGGARMSRVISGLPRDTFCSLSPQDVVSMAYEIGYEMERLWTDRAEVRARVLDLRRAFAVRLSALDGADSPIRLVGITIDPSCQAGEDEPPVHLLVHELDSSLRPGLHRHEVQPDDDAERFMSLVEAGWRATLGHRAEVRALGAVGWISGIAAGVARAAPQGEGRVLERLGREAWTHVTFPHARHDVRATLFWASGRVEAHVHRTNAFSAIYEDMHVDAVLPETARLAALGRRVDQILELPFRLDAEILSVAPFGSDQTEIEFAPDYDLLDADMRIRPSGHHHPKRSF